MILSERALKGNGDKLVKEFLSNLESASSWFDIREYFEWGCQSRVGRECEGQFHSFCNYYWKVANAKVRFRRGDNVLSFSQLCRSMSPTSYQLWIIVDHEHNRWNLVTRRQIQSTPDNSNPRYLEPRANLNQNRFSLDFRHTFTVILPSVTRPSITRTSANSNQFSFPLRAFSI